MSSLTVNIPGYRTTAPRGALWAAQAGASLIFTARAAWQGFVAARRLEQARRAQGADVQTVLAMARRYESVEPGLARELAGVALRHPL